MLNKHARKIPPTRPPAVERPSQNALKAPTNNEALNGGVESMQKRMNGLMSANNEDKVEYDPPATQSGGNGRRENDLLDVSIALSMDEAMRKESLKLKELEDMTNEHCGTESFDGKGPAIDTSIERNAAQIWPYCANPCQICQRTHVAIPGSPISQDCVRISMFIHEEPALVADETKRHSSLIPIDEYELALLGWLIWSTHAHQGVLKDAMLRKRPKRKRRRHYIRTEMVCSGKKSSWNHLNKIEFQSWWNGRKNLKSCAGMRWLNITFDWDMGKIDLLPATFGSAGRLFTPPEVMLLHGTGPEFPTNGRVKPQKENKSKSVEVAEGIQDDKSSNGNGNTGGGDSKIDKVSVEGEEDKHGDHKVEGGDLGKAEGQSSQRYSAFHQFRERPPSSSGTSSKGDDDDFM